MLSEEIVSVADELLPPTNVQYLLEAVDDRIEDELGEEFENFDWEFDELHVAEESDEWDRADSESDSIPAVVADLIGDAIRVEFDE